ncbi:hypothetical protein BGZ51_007754 [Haplosporangium sp. Z 767]|nr:hypothetical protein BGZ50_008057 [Haplosporangium sp. Z 11]KAF9178466.1 hypothetical protein BGZ51_007754 [Haplosporangium sp. Z 767]
MLPVLKGKYDSAIISGLPIDAFFKENNPSEWYPQEFAQRPSSKYLDIYFAGLNVIADLKKPPSAYAHSILMYLETDAGKIMVEDAERKLKLRRIAQDNQIEYAKMQTSHLSKAFRDASPSELPKSPTPMMRAGLRTRFLHTTSAKETQSASAPPRTSASTTSASSISTPPAYVSSSYIPILSLTSSPVTPMKSVSPSKRPPKRKRESTIAEPWRTLISNVLRKIKGESVTMAAELPHPMSEYTQILYKFIVNQLKEKERLCQVDEKDLLMERANEILGQDIVAKIKNACERPSMNDPTRIPGLLDCLAPLRQAFDAGGIQGLKIEVECGLFEQAMAQRSGKQPNALMVKVLDAIRHLCITSPSDKTCEAELVSIWKYILDSLSGRDLDLQSGELTSKATKWQRMLLKLECKIGTGAATYGRKVDLQCRMGTWELNNSEFKTSSASDIQAAVQYRKNLRINQAMMLYLQEKIAMPLADLEVLALDVRGHRGVVLSLKYSDDVFISSLASDRPLRLPDTPFTWKQFLNGETLAVLFNYVEHLKTVRDKVEARVEEVKEEQAFKPSHQVTPPNADLRVLADFTFLTPTKTDKSSVRTELHIGIDADETFVGEEDDGVESDDVYIGQYEEA